MCKRSSRDISLPYTKSLFAALSGMHHAFGVDSSYLFLPPSVIPSYFLLPPSVTSSFKAVHHGPSLHSIAAPVVDGAIEGLHGLIMAYGQTASGKSYTMGALQESRTAEAVDCIESNSSFTHLPSAPTSVLGGDPYADAGRLWESGQEARNVDSSATYVEPREERSSSANYIRCAPEAGIIPRALCRVFERITSFERASGVSVTVSLLQIYNEFVQVCDVFLSGHRELSFSSRLLGNRSVSSLADKH